MSCSRQSCAIDICPRNDASTISVFCCAENFRYFLVSLKRAPPDLERPMLQSARD